MTRAWLCLEEWRAKTNLGDVNRVYVRVGVLVDNRRAKVRVPVLEKLRGIMPARMGLHPATYLQASQQLELPLSLLGPLSLLLPSARPPLP